jgi:hypothetical protein
MRHEGNGWKELSFTIAKKIDGKDNPLTASLINEYLIKVDDGSYQDLFIISEPRLSHNNAALTIDATCNHISSRLRTKKLYLMFDDTNGIGTCQDLVNTILFGTGWSLGAYDVFYEADGTTEKIRTLTSGGKEGAFQLINKVCELFNAKPIYHGVTKRVDIVAFSPYTIEPDGEYPVVHRPESIVELNYTKAMSGITRTLNTENLITRMYVEGDFGEDGYVGIEEVNPTGMNFILNFDYFIANGLFTAEHQTIVDEYLANIRSLREQAQNDMTAINASETRLMELWGTADYSIFDVTAVVDGRTFDLVHVTSLDNAYNDVLSGNRAVYMMNDGTHIYTTVDTVSGSRYAFTKTIPNPSSVSSILIYRLLPSGTIGGKESAAEAAEITLDNMSKRIGDNLVKNSDVAVSSTSSLVRTYTLTEDWQVGKTYTITVYGTTNDGNAFAAYRDSGVTGIGLLTFDPVKRVWSRTFTCTETTEEAKNILTIYNTPENTATQATITKVKVEFGEIATPWTPAENSSSVEVLDDLRAKIALLYNGEAGSPGIYLLTVQAVEEARTLQQNRDAYAASVTSINATEAAFADDMGDLLRDGYWQDKNYIVGQEESLFSDAIETLKVMAKPVAEYTLEMINMNGMDAAPHMNVSVNSAVHIIDDDAAINSWGYVEQVEYCLDMPYENSLKISTHEAKFAGQSFTQMLSAIAETTKEVRAKQNVYNRATVITDAGKVPTNAI